MAPSDTNPANSLAALGAAGATCLETFLASKTPTVLALTAGRSLRAMVKTVSPMNTPHHKILSLQGHMSPDGRTSHYEVVMGWRTE